MHDQLSAYAPTLGRILLGGYFLWSGIQTVLHFSDAVVQMNSTYAAAPVSLTILIIVIEVLAGTALVAAYKTRFSALILAIFTILLLAFEPFLSTGQPLTLERVAIVGGLLYVAGTTKPRG